jgi:prepilin-type N-terminal cleavage/methylation domain-containing protein
MNRRLRNAFTLVELLVVAIILCILMAILLPRYLGGKDPVTGKKVAAPKERAQAVAGVSYISQINQAISMYKMDNDDALPPDLQALKRYGVTDEMLIDPVSRQPLQYDPQTGQVTLPDAR